MEPTQPQPSSSEAPKASLSVGPLVPEINEQEPVVEYKILTLNNYRKVAEEEQGMVPLEYKDDESLRAFYVARTEALIDEATKTESDVMLFLDKSARPIAWMVNEMWDIFAPDKPKPEFKFVNIDAAEWANLSSEGSRPTDEDMRDVQVPKEAIDELRDVFTVQKQGQPHQLMDGKNIMIVDEISTTGATLRFAHEVVREAFRDARSVQARAWMHATFIKQGQGLFPREIPVWYHHAKEEGRGVGDRQSGSYWLSRRFEKPDQEALQLRAEIHQLAEDVKSGKQAIIPEGDFDDPKYSGMRIRKVTDQV